MTTHRAHVLELSIRRMTALMSGTAVSMQGRISIIQCYGRQMTLWEEQWAMSSQSNCHINKVTLNSVSACVSAPQSAGRWHREVSMECCSFIVTCVEIFSESCLHLQLHISWHLTQNTMDIRKYETVQMNSLIKLLFSGVKAFQNHYAQKWYVKVLLISPQSV